MTDPVAHIPPLEPEGIEVVVGEVELEIQRQDDLARAGKFGGTHILPGGPNADRLGVLVEEVGEVAEAINEIRMGRGDTRELFKELIQVAACAVAWATAVVEGRAER